MGMASHGSARRRGHETATRARTRTRGVWDSRLKTVKRSARKKLLTPTSLIAAALRADIRGMQDGGCRLSLGRRWILLSSDEVLRFLDCVPSLKHRAICTTCYAACRTDATRSGSCAPRIAGQSGCDVLMVTEGCPSVLYRSAVRQLPGSRRTAASSRTAGA